MSEWLGTGLQNRSHQFESGWNLRKNQLADIIVRLFFYGIRYDLRNILNKS